MRRVAELISEASLYHLAPPPAGAAMGRPGFRSGCMSRRPRPAPGTAGGRPVPRDDAVPLTSSGSTELLARIGDAEYRALRATHERRVRPRSSSAAVRLINVTGDGTFSLFDGPHRRSAGADQIARRPRARHFGARRRAPGGSATRTRLHRVERALRRTTGRHGDANEVLVSRAVHDLVVAGHALSSGRTHAEGCAGAGT